MLEGPSTSEITSFDQIDQTVCQELLAKSSVWDFSIKGGIHEQG